MIFRIYYIHWLRFESVCLFVFMCTASALLLHIQLTAVCFLQPITRMSSLRALNVSFWSLSDAAMQTLATLTQLQLLVLNSCQHLTDAGLSLISRVSSSIKANTMWCKSIRMWLLNEHINTLMQLTFKAHTAAAACVEYTLLKLTLISIRTMSIDFHFTLQMTALLSIHSSTCTPYINTH